MTRTPLSRSKGQRSRSRGRFGWLFKSLHNLCGRHHILCYRPERAPACRPWGGAECGGLPPTACLITELIFKYRWQIISVSNTATCLATSLLFNRTTLLAYRARETVQLLTCETPDFITPVLWPANSPDLNPVDYQISGEAAGTCVLHQDAWCWPAEVTPDWRVEHFHQVFIDEAIRQWRPRLYKFALEHTEDTLNTDF